MTLSVNNSNNAVKEKLEAALAKRVYKNRSCPRKAAGFLCSKKGLLLATSIIGLGVLFSIACEAKLFENKAIQTLCDQASPFIWNASVQGARFLGGVCGTVYNVGVQALNIGHVFAQNTYEYCSPLFEAFVEKAQEGEEVVAEQVQGIGGFLNRFNPFG